jgi:pre-mRNA-splicing factor 38B
MTFGQLVKGMLTKLDWYGTLFPRIPVPIQVRVCARLCKSMRIISLQKEIEDHLAEYNSGGVEAAMGMSGGNRQERYRELERRRNRNNDVEQDEQQPDEYQNQRRQERKRNAGEPGSEEETWPTLPATTFSAPNTASTRQLRRRCTHHLRHHHCIKHRHTCPSKSATTNQESMAASSSGDGQKENPQ